MNVNNINFELHNLNFTSGLTKSVLLKEKLIKPSIVEKELLNKYEVQAEFAGNNAIALTNKICSCLIESLSEIFKILNL